MGNSLNSRSTRFLDLIRALIIDLEDFGHSIKFLWAPSHAGIKDNEKAEFLAKSTCKFTTRLVNKITSLDMNPHFYKVLRNAWCRQ